MDGILPLWKPAGMTSHDCVFKIRKLFGTKKAGHTGTLDPDVEGVLPVCIGRATKIAEYLQDAAKLTKVKQRSGFQRRQKMLPAISLKKRKLAGRSAGKKF